MVAEGRLIRPLAYEGSKNLDRVFVELLLQIDPRHGVGDLIDVGPLLTGPLSKCESGVKIAVLLGDQESKIVQSDWIIRLQAERALVEARGLRDPPDPQKRHG